MPFNLEVFTLSDRQTFKAILQEFESDGITDIAVIRQRLHESIEASVIKLKRNAGPQRWHKKVDRISNSGRFKKCPQCGKKMTIQRKTKKDYVWECKAPKGCSYSEYLGDSK